jgi:hypothetical protein
MELIQLLSAQECALSQAPALHHPHCLILIGDQVFTRKLLQLILEAVHFNLKVATVLLFGQIQTLPLM